MENYKWTNKRLRKWIEFTLALLPSPFPGKKFCFSSLSCSNGDRRRHLPMFIRICLFDIITCITTAAFCTSATSTVIWVKNKILILKTSNILSNFKSKYQLWTNILLTLKICCLPLRSSKIVLATDVVNAIALKKIRKVEIKDKIHFCK